MTTNDKYFLVNRDNLMQPIPMQISEKQIKSLISRSNFWYLDQILSILKKKRPSKLIYSRKYGLENTCSDKYLKGPVAQDPSTSNMANSTKHCWNLHDSTCIISIDHRELNWAGKSLS